VKKAVIGDGAEWIWNNADLHFPGAIQIVDLYHARQYLWDVARKLHRNDEANQKAWMKVHQKRLLDQGKIEKLVLSLRSIDSTNPEVVDKIRIEADYFEKNAGRMRYPRFRRQHLFAGSGVIEAGCKTVIGSRLKQSGMFWTVRGAIAARLLLCLQQDQFGPKGFQSLLQLKQTGLSARQIAAAALLFESKGGFKRAVGAKGGHRAFQAVRMMLQGRGVAAGDRALYFFEGGRIIVEEQLNHFFQQLDVAAHAAERQRFVQLLQLRLHGRPLGC
jgi:hypothetical protein